MRELQSNRRQMKKVRGAEIRARYPPRAKREDTLRSAKGIPTGVIYLVSESSRGLCGGTIDVKMLVRCGGSPKSGII
jgi:hypothetical protein